MASQSAKKEESSAALRRQTGQWQPADCFSWLLSKYLLSTRHGLEEEGDCRLPPLVHFLPRFLSASPEEETEPRVLRNTVAIIL